MPSSIPDIKDELSFKESLSYKLAITMYKKIERNLELGKTYSHMLKNFDEFYLHR